MSGDLFRIVDAIHREKSIPKEVLFEGIENALSMAARKHFPDALEIEVAIDGDTGQIRFTKDGQNEDPTMLGRIAAQTAKQVMIQKIREAERDTLFDEFETRIGDLVTGTVQRFERGAVTVNLGSTDALMPRSEQIPGESYNQGERVRGIIREVRKAGQRVKIILSRTHPDFVRGLFELEIPEIAEQVIAIRALAREAGYRSKVAVSSIDSKVDAVGACVGVRGTRIKNIVEELNSERIDIVRWNESLQVLIPNALQPAEIEEVMLCQLLGRAIVLVRSDQLSLAIGRRGQNVRLASKLVGWDIEIMTPDELNESIEKAIEAFMRIDQLSEPVSEHLAERLVEQGILSYDDLSIMEIEDLLNTIEDLTQERAIELVTRAEQLAEELEEAGSDARPGRSAASPESSEGSAQAVPTGDDQQPPDGESESVSSTNGSGQEQASETGPGEQDDLEEETSTEASSNGIIAEDVDSEAHDGLHDVDLAEEASHRDVRGHEVSHAPVDTEDPMDDPEDSSEPTASSDPEISEDRETGELDLPDKSANDLAGPTVDPDPSTPMGRSPHELPEAGASPPDEVVPDDDQEMDMTQS